MADILSQEILDQLPDDFQVEIAGLTDAAQAQVIESVQAAADEGDLTDFNTDSAIADAQEVSDRQETVTDLNQQQADAVADGDYAKAADLADQEAWEIKEIQDAGGEGDAQLVRAETDEVQLQDAQDHHETAVENAAWAENLAESGQTDSAQVYADSAATHEAASVDAAATADVGGTYADHSYDAPASTGTDTTAE